MGKVRILCLAFLRIRVSEGAGFSQGGKEEVQKRKVEMRRIVWRNRAGNSWLESPSERLGHPINSGMNGLKQSLS